MEWPLLMTPSASCLHPASVSDYLNNLGTDSACRTCGSDTGVATIISVISLRMQTLFPFSDAAELIGWLLLLC